MSNFHPLEVVGRGGETQIQLGENLDKFTQLFKGYHAHTACIISWIYMH